VAPVFLLTAIATLISALNVRLGRIVDRQRALLELNPATDQGGASLVRQRELALLSRRVHLSYLAILAAVVAGLFICLVVASAFVGVLLEADLAKLLAALFVLAMLSLIASFGLFLREIYLAVSGRKRTPPPAAEAATSAGPGSA
jgi:nitrate reductase gamma subunit